MGMAQINNERWRFIIYFLYIVARACIKPARFGTCSLHQGKVFQIASEIEEARLYAGFDKKSSADFDGVRRG